jgi:hypothetical protein
MTMHVGLLHVPMVNLTVMVTVQNVSMVHGHVTAMVTVIMVLMKLIAVEQIVPMANLTVAMDLVSMVHGHVTAMVTVPTVLMKLTVVEQIVPMANLTVAMDLVSLVHGHVTAMVTVPTVLMKLTVKVAKVVNMTGLPTVLLTVMLHGLTSV